MLAKLAPSSTCRSGFRTLGHAVTFARGAYPNDRSQSANRLFEHGLLHHVACECRAKRRPSAYAALIVRVARAVTLGRLDSHRDGRFAHAREYPSAILRNTWPFPVAALALRANGFVRPMSLSPVCPSPNPRILKPSIPFFSWTFRLFLVSAFGLRQVWVRLALHVSPHSAFPLPFSLFPNSYFIIHNCLSAHPRRTLSTYPYHLAPDRSIITVPAISH